MCDIVPVRGKKIIGAIVMGKREFTNRLSLRGAYLYATWQSRQNKIVGRDPYVGFLILLRMTIRMISRDPYVSPSDFLRMTNLKQPSLCMLIISRHFGLKQEEDEI